MPCPLAQTVAVIGDGWTLLILREAFFGTTRFGEFEQQLGVARNVLTQRLEHLVDEGVMTKELISPSGRRCEYKLTLKGFDLLTALIALRQWSERRVYGKGKEPLLVVDRRTGKPVQAIQLLDEKGKRLDPADLVLVPGDGADRETTRRFGADGLAEPLAQLREHFTQLIDDRRA